MTTRDPHAPGTRILSLMGEREKRPGPCYHKRREGVTRIEAWRNIRKSADKVLREIQKHRYIIVFDTETTGIGTKDKIIQFTAQRCRITEECQLEPMPGEENRMDLYIKPVDKKGRQEKLDKKIPELTGITDDILAHARPEEERAEEIVQFMDTVSAWAAYNAPFDVRMLLQMQGRLEAAGHPCPLFREDSGRRFRPKPAIDILPMARDCTLELEDHHLGTVAGETCPENHYRFHDASEDVRATIDVMNYCLRYYKDILKEKPESLEAPEVKYAYYWKNIKSPKQQRIRVALALAGDEKERPAGQIYWDVIKKHWSCKTDKESRDLFRRVDMEYVEWRLLEIYRKKHRAGTMEELARALAKEGRERGGT